MSFTNPTTSQTLTQRRMNGWGQAMAFPGPPPMTIEDPGDIARESSINVQGANIRVPDMMNAFNMSYDPSLNSPVFNYQNNPSSTIFGLQSPFQNLGQQSTDNQVGTIQYILDQGIDATVTVITGASLVTGYLRFTTTTLTFTNGVLSGSEAGSNIDIATATCT
jgi:hypothetical protein